MAEASFIIYLQVKVRSSILTGYLKSWDMRYCPELSKRDKNGEKEALSFPSREAALAYVGMMNKTFEEKNDYMLVYYELVQIS